MHDKHRGNSFSGSLGRLESQERGAARWDAKWVTIADIRSSKESHIGRNGSFLHKLDPYAIFLRKVARGGKD